MATRECPNCGSYNGLGDNGHCQWCGWKPMHDARTELAERALQACKQYGHGYRFRTKAAADVALGVLMAEAEVIAAELAALEANP